MLPSSPPTANKDAASLDARQMGEKSRERVFSTTMPLTRIRRSSVVQVAQRPSPAVHIDLGCLPVGKDASLIHKRTIVLLELH